MDLGLYNSGNNCVRNFELALHFTCIINCIYITNFEILNVSGENVCINLNKF